MIRHLVLFAALAASAGAAHACSCDDPASMSVEDREKTAQWIVEQGLIVAEVIRLPQTDMKEPERYRVVRQIVGGAPAEITVQRHVTHLPNGQVVVSPVTSCDYSGTPGERVVMAFTDRGTAPSCGVLSSLTAATRRVVGMCTQFAVQNAAILERVKQLSSAASRR